MGYGGIRDVKIYEGSIFIVHGNGLEEKREKRGRLWCDSEGR